MSARTNTYGVIFTNPHPTMILEGTKTQTRRTKVRWRAGDILVMKESWRVVGWQEDGGVLIEYRDGTQRHFVTPECDDEWFERIWIACGEECEKGGWMLNASEVYEGPGDIPTRWRSPLYQKWFTSRARLKVIKVWDELLWDISERDAYAEGWYSRSAFVKLYQDMHSAPCENLFVYATEFELMEADTK